MARVQRVAPVRVPETVLLVPADHRGLYNYITITMDMVDSLLLDTMDTVLVLVLTLVIMGFNHKVVRVRVCMALAALVVLLDMVRVLVLVLVLVLVRDLVLVLMNSIHKGLRARVCMGMDMGILDTMGMVRMGGEEVRSELDYLLPCVFCC